MNQRQPRVEDEAWLAEVRKMPCLVCQRPAPSDPAHLRSAARQYGKRQTGLGEKPDDKWVLPLCRQHHDEQHRRGDELAWWTSYGIDPFALAIALYATRPVTARPRARREARIRPRKAPADRKKILAREAEWPSRPLKSRNTFQDRKGKKHEHVRLH